MPSMEYLLSDEADQRIMDILAVRGLSFAFNANREWGRIFDPTRNPEAGNLEVRFARYNNHAARVIGRGGKGELSPVITDPMNHITS